MQYAKYDTREEAQKAFDLIIMLMKLRPSTSDGEREHKPFGGYEYRLMEDTPMVANGLENRGV